MRDGSRIPVLVGIGQSIERDSIVTARELATRAARAALDEAPGLAGAVQRLSTVAISFSPAGPRIASEIARDLGLSGASVEVSTPGGNASQWLVNRACEEIAKGRLETTLIVGAEATRSMRASDPSADFMKLGASNLKRAGTADADPIVGDSLRGMFARQEIKAGLTRPTDVYALLESAWMAAAGADATTWRGELGRLLARASDVAARNPFAWFREPLSAAAIAEVSPDNRIIAEPYTKRMNSFANVDQGAALLLTTLERARAAGLLEQCVFPLAGASASDVVPTARTDLTRSPGLAAAAGAAFAAAGLDIDDVDTFDLYSCFPVAVEAAAREIGLALEDPRGFTMTGGLPFFGGPGNNYSTHGIAASALGLRELGDIAYVSANGGLLSKHVVTLYGAAPSVRGYVTGETCDAQRALDADSVPIADDAEGEARVLGATVVYDRSGHVAAAPIIAALPDGRHCAARAEASALPDLVGRSLVGETVRVSGASPVVYAPE